jgi:hypothetical protein
MLWIKLNLPSVNMFEYVPAPVETFPTETAVFIVLITIFKHSISVYHFYMLQCGVATATFRKDLFTTFLPHLPSFYYQQPTTTESQHLL